MKRTKIIALASILGISSSVAVASDYYDVCADLPGHGQFRQAVNMVVDAADSAGLDNEMWVSAVNRDGVVCAVARSGKPGEQWPGSRVISAQKANTANAFSLPGATGKGLQAPLSTANLWAAVQPGGSLFGLQHSNPVDARIAYKGNSNNWGTRRDPLTGKKVGGVNVFGGGLALYNDQGDLVGALGVSGDTSCTDHIVAWKIRDALGLDNVPGGLSGPDGGDNIIYDIQADGSSTSGFGHPVCLAGGEVAISEALPMTHPVGPNM
jgi:uncharacterized protein GlcG (DUF336 family)